MQSFKNCFSNIQIFLLLFLMPAGTAFSGEPDSSTSKENPFSFIRSSEVQKNELGYEVMDILSESCAMYACHSGPEASKKLNLSEDAFVPNLINVKSAEVPQFMLIKPGDATNSYLLKKIRGASDMKGEQMPRGGDPLPEEDIAIIEEWINSLPKDMGVEGRQP